MSALESLCLIAENTVSGGFPECEVSPVTTITLTSFHPQTTGTIQKPAERSFSQESFSSSPVVHSIQKVCVQRACMRLTSLPPLTSRFLSPSVFSNSYCHSA